MWYDQHRKSQRCRKRKTAGKNSHKLNRRNQKIKAKRKKKKPKKNKLEWNPMPIGYDDFSDVSFYCVLNTSFRMDQGTAAAAICIGFMSLYMKLELDDVKGQYLDTWTSNGQRILVFSGYDHNHLKFLEKEVKYSALDSHSYYKTWGKGRVILVLTIFGREDNLEEIFDGLPLLR